MIILQALLIAILATMSQWWFSHMVTRTLLYPIWTGFLVGIILGNPMLGMQAGAYIQLTYLGWIVAGGAMPGNLMVAGIFGTALTILSGADATMATTLAVTLSVVGIVMNMAYMNLNVIWTHRADRYLAEGNIKMVRVMNYLPSGLLSALIYGVPAFLMVVLGASYATNVLSIVPQWLANALNLVGAIMPALGIAMLLNFLGKKKIIAFFFLGYFLTVYFSLDTMAVFIFSCVIAAVMFFFMGSSKAQPAAANGAPAIEEDDDDDF